MGYQEEKQCDKNKDKNSENKLFALRSQKYVY